MAWYFLTYLFVYFENSLYAITQAILGRLFGITVEHVSVGMFKVYRSDQLSLGFIPNGAYTKFRNLTDDEEEVNDVVPLFEGKPFPEASTVEQILINLVGPVIIIVLGSVMLCLPIHWESPQVAVDPQGRWFMTTTNAPTSIAGQIELLKSYPPIAVNYFFKEKFSKDKHPRPAPEPFDLRGWSTTMGMICIYSSLINLIPMLPLNGGHIVRIVWDRLFGKLSDNFITGWTVVGMIPVALLHLLFMYCLLFP